MEKEQTMNSSTRTLIRQRAACLGLVTKMKHFVDSYSESENNVVELKVREESLERTRVNHSVIIERLLEVVEDDYIDELDASSTKFDDAYFSVKALLAIKIEKFSPSAVSMEELNHIASSQGQKAHVIKVPDIKIPTFNGDFKDWFTFRDTFIAIVHNNTQLEDIVKFTILIDRLEGDARASIGQIAMTSAGYKEAWEKLLDLYNDNQRLINYHIDKLVSLPQCKKNSSMDLKGLINQAIANVSALTSMGNKIESIGEAIIIRLVTTKLDAETRSLWSRKLETREIPKYNKLIEFLQKQCHDMESNTMKLVAETHPVGKQFNRSFHTTNSPSDTKQKVSRYICSTCKQVGHAFFKCPTFLALSVEERKRKAMFLGLCLNCVREGHQAISCPMGGCRFCNKKHNSLLHMNSPQSTLNHATSSFQPTFNNLNSQSTSTNLNFQPTTSSQTYCSQLTMGKQILLSTAVIQIRTGTGKFIECRALLDSGSQSNFVSERLAKKLNVIMSHTNIPISGLNSSQSTVKEKLTTTIKSRARNYTTQLEFLVVPIITESLPSQFIDISLWSIPSDITLADPQFNFVGDIDVLIGAELFFNILEHRRIQLKDGLPMLQLTKFGWIICGKLDNSHNHESLHNFVSLDNVHNSDNLQQQLEMFWSTETFPRSQMLSKEEQQCEDHFIRTHSRTSSGRYVVRLPFNDNVLGIGDSREQALRRFSYLEKKLNNNKEIKEQYQTFMDEYVALNHMEKVVNDNSITNFYLPHHAVFKPDSSTTSCRVVFDGSAKSSSGISLNDALMIGGSTQQDLFSIMLRQRKYQIALVADVQKMYRQIEMHQDDMDYQRILWRNHPSETIATYRLKTVTYGTASAPFLATRALKQLAIDEKDSYPTASQILLNDFYVDDALTGANTIEEATLIIKELTSLLKAGGFKLHKWSSNSQQVAEAISVEFREAINVNNNKTIKTLGLLWQPESDQYLFNVMPMDNTITTFTKRSVVSEVAKLYDPHGYLSPVIVLAKILIQRLWEDKCDWADTINKQHQEVWTQFRSTLPAINKIRFDRCVLPANPQSIQLHGFADASEKAYGACIYIRAVDEQQKVSVKLLCSKSRVAPLKPILVIARLELEAALLLSRLTVKTIDAMNMNFNDVFLWSDSKVTLAWIKSSPHRFQSFVANRISNIQEKTNKFTWNYINTLENPADIISRGMMPRDLEVNDMWWNGAHFLYDPDVNFNKAIIEINNSELPEERTQPRTVLISTSLVSPYIPIIYKFSYYLKVINTVAYCKRFITNCRQGKSRKSTINKPGCTIGCSGQVAIIITRTMPPSPTEIQEALESIIKVIQELSFSTELSSLKRNKFILRSSKLISLNPFLDTNNLIRVGGRLKNADIEYNSKHQYLLPSHHHFTTILIRYHHHKSFHAGPQLVLSLIRQNFWPINAKVTIKKVIRSCIKCFINKPKVVQQLMGNLPFERFSTNSRSFDITGVDLSGPFNIKNRNQRRGPLFKTYVAHFVCLTTKEVYFDLVSDLTAESFIATMKRFLSSGKRPQQLVSDNGTNFVGANKVIQEQHKLFQEECNLKKIIEFSSSELITWKFIPPRSPNFGGLWEATVKSFKFHLKRVINNEVLTYEELYTLVKQIQGILNSRPLSPLSDDPNDLQPLTPAHFTCGGPPGTIDEQSLEAIPSNRLTHWQRISKMYQGFWKRFHLEYLHNLQQRHKWQRSTENLKVNDIVLVAEEHTPPNKWHLGIITELFIGNDGKCRVANVQSQQSIYKRPTSKLCRLPFEPSSTGTAININ